MKLSTAFQSAEKGPVYKATIKQLDGRRRRIIATVQLTICKPDNRGHRLLRGDKVLCMLLRQCGVTEQPIFDLEHIARKLERLKIIARSFGARFRLERGIKARILATLDRINWRLWHGQREAALRMIKTGETLITRLARRGGKARPPPKALSLRTGINLLPTPRGIGPGCLSVPLQPKASPTVWSTSA